MKLIDIINSRIELLNKKIEESKDYISMLENDRNTVIYKRLQFFMKDLNKVEDIRHIGTSAVSKALSTYSKNLNSEELERKLREIKVTYIAKYDKNIKVELDNEQIKFLTKYIKEVERLIDYLERRIKENNDDIELIKSDIESKLFEINSLKTLLEKITLKKEMLDENDFNLINKMIDDNNLDYESKKNLLIGFRNYNIDFVKKEEKPKEEKTVEEKPQIELEDSETKKLFEEFGYSNTMFKYINKYRKEINSNLDIKEARSILEYLKDNNIIKRFSEADLLAVCTYGTLDSVSKMYERLKKDNNHVYSVFYESPTIWVDEIKKGKRKKRIKDGKNMPKEITGVLKTSIMKASYEDMLLNDKFFREHDYDINLKNSKNKLALTTPHSKVLENYKTFASYGIHKYSKDVSSIFSYSNLTEKLDKFVELGLLNGFSGSYDNANYIKYNPSFILSATETHYAYLYFMREEEPQFYYQKLFSNSRNGEIKNEYKKSDLLKTKLLGSTKEFIEDKFIMPKEYLRNYDYYEEILNNAEDKTIDPDVYSTPEIIELENSARIPGNEYVYVIGDVTFSRIKILRNYSIIRRYSKEIYEDAFMYCVTKGSYLSEEAVKRVSDCIMYTYTNTSSKKGGHHGLFKSL